jgi:two-component system, LytTR family, response regulator AlgR
MAREAEPGGREYLSVHERGRMLLVPVREVIYFKAELKYVTIRTVQREYLTEESLVALEEEMAARFVRVHRNALVARAFIEGFERVESSAVGDTAGEPRWVVVLRGIPDRVPVSRRLWPTVKSELHGR